MEVAPLKTNLVRDKIRKAGQFCLAALLGLAISARAESRFSELFLQAGDAVARDPKEAIKLYADALQQWTPQDGNHLKALALGNMGTVMINSDARKALDVLSQSLAVEQNWTFYASRGSAHRVLDQFPEAIADFNKALPLAPDPDKSTIYEARGEVKALSDKPAESDFDAEEKLAKKSGQNGNRMSALSALAAIKCARRDLSGGLGDLKKIKTMRLTGLDYMYGQGACDLAEKNWSAAVTDFTRCIDYWRAPPSSSRTVGPESPSKIEQVITVLGPMPTRVPFCYDGRGLANQALGEKLFAKEDFKEACQLKLRKACRRLRAQAP